MGGRQPIYFLQLGSPHPPQVPKTRKTCIFLNNQPGSFLGSVPRGFTSSSFQQIFIEIPWGDSMTPIRQRTLRPHVPRENLLTLAVSTREDNVSSPRISGDRAVLMKKPGPPPAWKAEPGHLAQVLASPQPCSPICRKAGGVFPGMKEAGAEPQAQTLQAPGPY